MSNPHPVELNAEDHESLAAFISSAKTQADKIYGKLPLLGPIIWLMMQQTHTKHTLISEVEWRVLPALLLDQAKLFMRGKEPLAYVSWARFSEPVAQRYRLGQHHLGFTDWNSGDAVWLIDVVTPFGGSQEVMKDIRQNVFAGKALHQLVPSPTEPAKVLRWPEVIPGLGAKDGA